jgi:hypothetical protein
MEIWEELSVLTEILRHVVGLEVVVDAFVGPALTLQVGGLFHQIEGEGVTG